MAEAQHDLFSAEEAESRNSCALNPQLVAKRRYLGKVTINLKQVQMKCGKSAAFLTASVGHEALSIVASRSCPAYFLCKGCPNSGNSHRTVLFGVM